MLATVGSLLVGAALVAALYAAAAALWAIYRPNPHREADGRIAGRVAGRTAVYATAILLALALWALLVAFLSNQFAIRYVAEHSGRALPVYLKVSALWAGQEGSLLLWAFLQALFAALVVVRPSERARPLIPWTVVFLSITTAFFTAVTLFLSNPFARSVTAPADGLGLNPLLRHPGMVFHPPALYLGYVGLSIPFAFALAGLAVRRVDDWPVAARRWTLTAWLFLGLGLLLGARWAYDVLGWGGYWGWDAVENAGLLPWLTATALLHGLTMQRQRGGLRAWNLLLAVFSFALVLFGTFTTRSGLIESVHAFTRSVLGPYFLGAIGLALAGSLTLLIARRALLADPCPPERLLSREGAFLLTLILLLAIAASVLVGTLLPTLTGGRFEAGSQWFDRVTGPQFAALVLLTGVCPLVGRLAVLRRRAGESLLRGLWRLARTNPGAYLVHLGVILMAAGVVGTRMFPFETEVTLTAGEPVNIAGYTLVYEELQQEPLDDHMSTWAIISVYQDNRHLATLEPRLDYYPASDQTVTLPALRSTVGRDLYLVLYWWSVDGGSASLQAFVNPLVNFLWLGGVVLLAGGVVAWGMRR